MLPYTQITRASCGPRGLEVDLDKCLCGRGRGAPLKMMKRSWSQPQEYILSDGEDASDTDDAICRVREHVLTAPRMRFQQIAAVLQLLRRAASPCIQTARFPLITLLGCWFASKYTARLSATLLKQIVNLVLRLITDWVSTQCHPPRCIDAVAVNPTEVLLSWTPSRPESNCIYRENYICAWRQVAPSLDVQESWREKVVTGDLYENVQGSRRWATHLELPENSVVHIRMCARNCWGRSSWSSEIVKVTTHMWHPLSELVDGCQVLPLISVQSPSKTQSRLPDLQRCMSAKNGQLCIQNLLASSHSQECSNKSPILYCPCKAAAQPCKVDVW